MWAGREIRSRLLQGVTGFVYRAPSRLAKAGQDDLRWIAEEQAALRRVATLVAQGVLPEEVLGAVAVELGRLLRVGYTTLSRFDESAGTKTVVAAWSDGEDTGYTVEVGSSWPLEEGSLALEILRTGRTARKNFLTATDAWAPRAQAMGVASAVSSPIKVAGRLWGSASVFSRSSTPLPPSAEQRISNFIELAATAIANAESHAELAASRSRVVAAADEARRRIEHDLHDGAQQRLVKLQLDLCQTESELPAEQIAAKKLLSQSVSDVTSIVEELREISRGIYPAALSRGGLRPALKTLARRSAVPVELDLPESRRFPERLETTVYYVVSEALTNAAKHAQATVVHVGVRSDDTAVRLCVQDDGIGGADPMRGSGLIGLMDRVAALNGTITITSPEGQGTTLWIKIPLNNECDQPHL